MTLFSKIRLKFQNLLGFEKLNPLDNFDFDENVDEAKFNDNIELFKKAIENHPELKEVIWIGIYHCLNTYESNKEYLTVLNNDFEIIADLVEGNNRKVFVPDFIKDEYNQGNVLATFHNHFEGAILPSNNDFNNSILPNLKFTIITSENIIGIIVNNISVDFECFQMLINEFKMFEIYVNFCFSNDQFENIENLEDNFEGEELKKEREILFNNYISDNIEKFVFEFNDRMEKFNVYLIYIKL